MLRILTGGLILLGLTFSGVRGELDIAGRLKTFSAINPNDVYRWDKLYSQVQLNFSGRTGDRVGYRADFVARYDYLSDQGATAPRSTGLAIYPAEMYLDYYGKWLDVRIGQQYLFWGRADWVNPTDVFNPWDYTNMSSDIEDYRIPIPAVKASIYPVWGHLEVIYAPRLIPDKLPVPFSPSVADNRLAMGQSGLRFARDLSIIGWSVYGYHGWRKKAELEETILTSDDRIVQVFRFHSLDMVGADFIFTGEKWAFKGEGSFNFSDDRRGDDPTVINDNFFGTFGGDWIPNDKFSLNLQGSVRHYFNYDKASESQRLLQLNLQHFMPVYETTGYSVSNVIRYKVTNFINLQSVAVLNLADRDWFWLPFLSWEMADATHLTLGGLFFDGPTGSDFGNSAGADEVFLQLSTSF